MHRVVVIAGVLFLSAAGSGACVTSTPPPSDESLGQTASAVVSGSADATGVYSAVGTIVAGTDPLTGGNCSATLIADRVMLTAGHCVAPYLTGCVTLSAAPLGVMFATKFGDLGATPQQAKKRIVPVLKIIGRYGAIIPIPDPQNPVCCDPATVLHRTNGAIEPTLMFLGASAPADVKPMPVLVHPSVPKAKAYIASVTLRSFAGISAWGDTHPTVTIAGYGRGSNSYKLGTGFARGRDFGITTWAVTTGFFARSGMDANCKAFGAASAPGVGILPVNLCGNDIPVDIINSPSFPVPSAFDGQHFGSGVESTAGDGDSGGPAIAGLRANTPPAFGGFKPTQLPAPSGSDGYDMNEQYVIGVASNHWTTTGIDPACKDDGGNFGATYAPTYTVDIAPLFSENLADADHDGVADPIDQCWGDDHLDTDNDSIPDCLDKCPCDEPDLDFIAKGVALIDNDQDGDGLCRHRCGDPPGAFHDNCPYVPNVAQSNINAISELAHQADERGTECDSAVTPLVVAPPVVVDEKKVGAQTCTTYDRGTFGFRGMASRHEVTGLGYYPPAPVATGVRTCIPSATISCVNPNEDMRDAVFDKIPNGAPSEGEEKATTHWHRPTLQPTPACNKPNCPPTLKPDDTFLLAYNSVDTEPASPTSAKYRWRFQDVDYPKWFGKGWLPLGSKGPQDLAVNFMAHSTAPWGGASGLSCPKGNLLGTCDVGAQLHLPKDGDATGLNNFYYKGDPKEDDFQPLFTECGFLHQVPLFEVFPQPPLLELPHVVVQPGVGPTTAPASSSSFKVGPAGTASSAILVPLPGGAVGALSAALGTSFAKDVTPQVGTNLAAALTSGTPLWQSVEPSPNIGVGPTFPAAVGLSANGNQITVAARVTGATISASGDAPLCTAPAAPAAPAVVRTFGSFGSGPGQLFDPVGVGVDAARNTFVTDRENRRICKFGSDGGFLSCWGTPGSGDGEFGGYGSGLGYGPYGLEVDKGTGRVCVADTVNSRVQCFDNDGAFLFKFGSPGVDSGQFASEIGLGIDPSTHDIYVADTFAHRVQVFDAWGVFLRQWGSYGTAPGQLAYPRDVAVDARGNVYVAEWDNSRISKFDRAGNFIAMWGTYGSDPGQLKNPHAVAVDAAGLVYVGDVNNSRVQVFAPNGALVALWGSYGGDLGQFRGAIGVDLDAAGNVYVSDHFNNRVQVFAPLANGCASCPSGQCLADHQGVCCEQACGANGDCASGFCSAAGRCAEPPRSGSPHAAGFAAVLTRYRRGLFVVGGDDPTTKQPTGEMWFTLLGSNGWNRISSPGYAPERVLGATYSFAADRLYVLDVKQGQARLTAIDPIAGTVSPMGSWPRHSEWDRVYLVVDRDGGLLVASSRSGGKKHAIFRFDVKKSPPAVDGVEKGKRAFVYQPVVDMSGYTLVLRQDEGNDKIEVIGEHALSLAPATLADLGEQL